MMAAMRAMNRFSLSRFPLSRYSLMRWMFAAILLLCQGMAFADDEGNGPPIDARWRGFPNDSANSSTPPKVWLPGGGVAGTWIIFILLGILCIGFLFMNAKRTHLD